MAKLMLLPDTSAQRAEIVSWVEAMLADVNLAPQQPRFPLGGKVAIYVDGSLRVLQNGEQWQDDGVASLYVGYRHSAGAQYMQPLDRLAVVGAVISLADLWERFHETYIARAAAILISNYQGVMSGLIQTEAAVSGLAFSPDRALVAGRIGDCYHLPDGTQVEIDDSWTLVPDRPAVHTAG
jgi:hypothetical protein